MTDHPPRLAIAVVDDDQRILESLGSLLESADYAVRLLPSALALLESGCLAEIDCLISDIDMPVMDGFELLRTVHLARPELPIILITDTPTCWIDCRKSARVTAVCSRNRSTGRNYSWPSATPCRIHSRVGPSRDSQNLERERFSSLAFSFRDIGASHASDP
jgi:hypothetical protein